MSWFRPKTSPTATAPVRGRHASHRNDVVGVLSPSCEACRPLLVENITRAAEVGWSREFMRTVLTDVDAA